MHQLHSLRTVIITASDAQYFDLAQGTILSILEAQKTNQTSIGFLDLGCTLEQIAWLKQRVDSIQKPIWHFDFPNQDKTPDYIKGLLVRPFLRQYFPDFDIYLWIDADAWVQDWLAPELYIHGAARRKGLAITPEYHRASQQLYGGLPNFWRWIYDRYLENFNEVIAQKLYSYPLCNAGVFALHKDAKHWELWEMYLKQSLQKKQNKMIKMSDQFVLNFLIYECGLFKDTEILPAWCNWIFNALPAWDKVQEKLVEPYLPHHPIGILHLAGRQNLSNITLQVTDGSMIEVSVRYPVQSNLFAGNISKSVTTLERMSQVNNSSTYSHSQDYSQDRWDYISPRLQVIRPDQAFPNMRLGQPSPSKWKYLRWQVPHKWYVDKRYPHIGFLSRDEAHILYNNALRFRGKKALEIGCWMGWSACHLMLAGVDLDIIDPILENPEVRTSVVSSLQTACQSAGIAGQFVLVPGYSPQKVEELALQHGRKWSLIFIDGEHGAPGPLNDAIACEKYAEADAMVLFHDLAAPDVAQGLDYFRDRGWHTMIYQTMQIMGVAWRGNVQPVQHQPDPRVNWTLPEHLSSYQIINNSTNFVHNNFLKNRTKWSTEIPQKTMFSIQRGSLQYSYKGTRMVKNPFDLALYPLLIWNNKPKTIIEIGSFCGGSAVWLADMLNSFNIDGHIYSVDINKVESVSHPLVTFLAGNGRALQDVFTVDFMNSLPRPLLVIEDADHYYETTLHVLEFFHTYLLPGEYIVIEDGIVSDMGESAQYHGGPSKALYEFLSTHSLEYEIDSNYCDLFGYNFTWCTNGFLKKKEVMSLNE